MSYLLEDRLDAALPYLEAAHAAQPDEPAFLNNLAILYMEKGNLDTALRYAEESAKLAPDVPEVKETLRQVREANVAGEVYRRTSRSSLRPRGKSPRLNRRPECALRLGADGAKDVRPKT